MSSTFRFRFPKDIPRETYNKIRGYSSYDGDSWVFNSIELQTLAEDLRPSHPIMAHLLLTSPRFEPARQYVEGLLDTIELSRATTTDFKIEEPEGYSLWPFQRVGVQFAMDKDRPGVLIADQMGCIAGATEIKYQRCKGTSTCTVSQLYSLFHRLKNDDDHHAFRVRCLKDDYFGPWPIQNVVYSGQKQTLQLLLESGKFLVATPDHEILTPSGFVRLDSLEPGDLVVTNGVPSCRKCGSTVSIVTYEHAKHRGMCRGREIVMVPDQERVVGVYPSKVVDTYDIMMKDPYRNFVANGIVIHNCGKTPQALSTVHNLRMTTGLIVCPNIAKINWYREARRWLPDQDWIQILSSDTPEVVGQIGRGVVVITNYEALVKYKDRIKRHKWEYIISDEAHFIKNEKSQRSKAVYEIGKRIDKKICLTGTPMSNGQPIDLWGIIHWIDPSTWPKKREFQMRYCGPERDYWAYGGYSFTGSSNESELQTILRSTTMIRRLKKDVLKDLPPKIRTVVEIPRDKRSIFTQALKAEKQHSDDIDRLLHRAEQARSPAEFIKVMNSFSFRNEMELNKVRLDTAKAKLPDVIRFIEGLVSEGEKVVVFAHHREITQGIHHHFGRKSRMVIGGVEGRERQEAIDDFDQRDDVRVWVGSYLAGGIAINLTAATTVVAAELMYDPGSMDQAEDRCHRIGQMKSVNVYYCVLEQSIDAKIAQMIVKKMDVTKMVLDGEGAHDQF